jgi:hypothetical protein
MAEQCDGDSCSIPTKTPQIKEGKTETSSNKEEGKQKIVKVDIVSDNI